MRQSTVEKAKLTISMPRWVRGIVESAVKKRGGIGDMSSWVCEAIVEKAKRDEAAE